jgi:hypothetical protein
MVMPKDRNQKRSRIRIHRPLHSITARPAKSIIPPDVVDGGLPVRPVLVRQSKLRYATYSSQKPTKASELSKPEYVWKTLEITIPREIVESSGWEAGMTVCMESYVDGRIRMFPAGDVMERDEEQI